MLTRTLTPALTRTRAGQGICYHLVTSRRFSKFLDYQVGPARGVGGRGLRGQYGGRDEDSGRERGRDQGWGGCGRGWGGSMTPCSALWGGRGGPTRIKVRAGPGLEKPALVGPEAKA